MGECQPACAAAPASHAATDAAVDPGVTTLRSQDGPFWGEKRCGSKNCRARARSLMPTPTPFSSPCCSSPLREQVPEIPRHSTHGAAAAAFFIISHRLPPPLSALCISTGAAAADEAISCTARPPQHACRRPAPLALAVSFRMAEATPDRSD